MFLIVDGYNLLRFAERLEGWESITDVTLCRMLSQYLRRTKAAGRVVFDGTGPRDKLAFADLPSLEVVFSGRRSSADSLIVGAIAADSAPKSLVIVSSDRELQAAAKKRKAVAIQSQVFFLRLVAELEKKRSTSREPPEKLSGITEGETEQWLKTFGFKK